MIDQGNMPAFPQENGIGDIRLVRGGLTKREYIAALALQGQIAAFGRDVDHSQDVVIVDQKKGDRTVPFARFYAEQAVLLADALLRELGRKITLGQAIGDEMSFRGWDIQVMSDKTGIAYTTLEEILIDKHVPDASAFFKICEVFEWSPDTVKCNYDLWEKK